MQGSDFESFIVNSGSFIKEDGPNLDLKMMSYKA